MPGRGHKIRPDPDLSVGSGLKDKKTVPVPKMLGNGTGRLDFVKVLSNLQNEGSFVLRLSSSVLF